MTSRSRHGLDTFHSSSPGKNSECDSSKFDHEATIRRNRPAANRFGTRARFSRLGTKDLVTAGGREVLPWHWDETVLALSTWHLGVAGCADPASGNPGAGLVPLRDPGRPDGRSPPRRLRAGMARSRGGKPGLRAQC